jgi:uncharacterized membrane protein YkoI
MNPANRQEEQFMLSSIRKAGVAALAVAALGLGGAAVADATGTSSSTTTRPRQTPLSGDVAAKVKAAALAEVPGATVLRTEAGGPDNAAYHAHIKTSGGKLEVVLVDASFQATAVQADRSRGRGGQGGPGGGHSPETPLTGDTRSKVEAAVLAKYPGATIERTETNTDGSAPYESHIKTTDGTELEVHVGSDFQVDGAVSRPAHP